MRNTSSTGPQAPRTPAKPGFRERVLKDGLQFIDIRISTVSAEIWAAPPDEPSDIELGAANDEIVQACRKALHERAEGAA